MSSTVLQVRIDKEIKQAAEKLYKDLGTSLPEAVRMFVSQSLREQGLPIKLTTQTGGLGSLSEFANPELRKLEESAWSDAAKHKHNPA